MGHCLDCGAPCQQCAAMTDLTLIRAPKEYRKKVKRLLADVGCTTNARANEFVNNLAQYDTKLILKCFRLWKEGGCSYTGKDERYFLGILRHNAVSVEPRLDSTPEIASYPEEDERECQDVHEVSPGNSGEPKPQQELPATDRSTEEGR